MMRKLALVGAFLVASVSAALAQSNCPYIKQGAVLTPAQWNQCFAAKNDTLTYVPVNRSGDTMQGRLGTIASSTTRAGLSIPPGTAPTSPVNGDIWTTSAGLFVQINGSTVGPIFSNTLANGRIFVGNASNVAAPVLVSGDGTLSNAGALVVTKTNGVNFGAFATGTDAANLTGTVASARVSGSYTGITGVSTLIAGATGAGFTIDLSTSTVSGTLAAARLPAFGSGDVSFASGGGAGTIGAARVTNAMLAGSIASSKLVGTDIATVGTVTVGNWSSTINTAASVRFSALTCGGGGGFVALDGSGNTSCNSGAGAGVGGTGGTLGQIIVKYDGTNAHANYFNPPVFLIQSNPSTTCGGTTVLSTVIGSFINSILNCDVTVAADDTIPAGKTFAVSCGSKITVNNGVTLTINAYWKDPGPCQVFTIIGTGKVVGLRYERPEYRGAVGDCNINGTCLHDDYAPFQATFVSTEASGASDGDKPTIQLRGGAGYGVTAGLVMTPTLKLSTRLLGAGSNNGGDGTTAANRNNGSWIISCPGGGGNCAAFTGDILTVQGQGSLSAQATMNWEVRDLGVVAFTAYGPASCLQIGGSGKYMQGPIHSKVTNVYLTGCKHELELKGALVREVDFDRVSIAKAAGSTGLTNGVWFVPDAAGFIGDMDFTSFEIQSVNNVNANPIEMSATDGGSVSGVRFYGPVIYGGLYGALINSFTTTTGGNIQDIWFGTGTQREGNAGISSTTGFSVQASGGTSKAIDIVFDGLYMTNVASGSNAIEAIATSSALVQGISVTNSWFAVMTASQVVYYSGVVNSGVDNNRFSDINNSNVVVLILNCAGGCSGDSNRIWRTSGGPTINDFVKLDGTTDYSTACNNKASGIVTPAHSGTNGGSGTHNGAFNTSPACNNW